MKLRYEVLIPLMILAYISFFPFQSGDLALYFVKFYILVPFVLVFIALNILSYGLNEFLDLAKNLRILVAKTKEDAKVNDKVLDGAISHAYVSSLLWIFYILVISSGYNLSSNAILPDVALSLTYGFILAEFILRPMKKRALYLKEAT